MPVKKAAKLKAAKAAKPEAPVFQQVFRAVDHLLRKDVLTRFRPKFGIAKRAKWTKTKTSKKQSRSFSES